MCQSYDNYLNIIIQIFKYGFAICFREHVKMRVEKLPPFYSCFSPILWQGPAATAWWLLEEWLHPVEGWPALSLQRHANVRKYFKMHLNLPPAEGDNHSSWKTKWLNVQHLDKLYRRPHCTQFTWLNLAILRVRNGPEAIYTVICFLVRASIPFYWWLFYSFMIIE